MLLLQVSSKVLHNFPCEDPRWYVLDFHHIDNNKEHNLGDLSCGKYSKKKILEEFSKCIPLCSNCHRELHYLEKNAAVAQSGERNTVTVEVVGSKPISCAIISDGSNPS